MSSSSRNPRGRTAVSRTLGAVAPLAGAAAALLCFTRTASAADLKWEYNPRVELGAIWDDNFRLTDQPGQEIQVTGASIDGALDIRGIGVGERTLLEFEPRVHSTYFPDESSENATDYYLNAAAERRTQRTVSRLPVTFAEESVVTAELLAADFPGIDLGQTVSGDTGRVSVRNRRRLITAVPQTTFDWTERRHLTFSLQYV
ncbi:MAG TPA: hypothetical protein VGO53_01435, partial [Steroidobacteraceae bacterium]|nr:hypothetical protein [Steroidobacteraceae bacterium]